MRLLSGDMYGAGPFYIELSGRCISLFILVDGVLVVNCGVSGRTRRTRRTKFIFKSSNLGSFHDRIEHDPFLPLPLVV